MESPLRLLGQRRFLPLFVTQFLGAFNDNLFKFAMVTMVTFHILKDPSQDTIFNAATGFIFILPFFILSALAGQLADGRDKAALIRIVKTAEIVIMLVGGIGLVTSSIWLMLTALFSMGVHSTFFGPIKYAILPQHLDEDHVLAGTGLVEAGTYIAILLGTVIGGLTGEFIPVEGAALMVFGVAILGRIAGHFVPSAPAQSEAPQPPLDFHIFRASARLVRETAHIPRVEMAIIAISFFWAIGAVFASLFPPLVENALHADQTVATIFLSTFSIGIAVGSITINRMLNGHVSARYSPVSVIVMGLFVLDLWWGVNHWVYNGAPLLDWAGFLKPLAGKRILFDLFGIAIAGGMFVVPLYAFLTTTVPKSETAKTIAANNIVNSGFMVLAAILLAGLTWLGVTIGDTLLMVALSCVISAIIAQKLHRLCD